MSDVLDKCNCDEAPRIVRARRLHDDSEMFFVVCPECGRSVGCISHGTVRDEEKQQTEVVILSGKFDSPVSALNAWNDANDTGWELYDD